jgi:hypothetical protein
MDISSVLVNSGSFLELMVDECKGRKAFVSYTIHII